MKHAVRDCFPGAIAALLLAFSGKAYSRPAVFHHAHKKSDTATVLVRTDHPGCSVDIDGTAQGKTASSGSLTIQGVSASDHYVHVDCSGQAEMTFFISPQADTTAKIQAAGGAGAGAGEATPLGEAENNIELRKLVSGAANDREDGQFPQAVESLRHALELDPENPGLHHELGMTFLMIHDWDRAAVELREAVRLDPASADAHDGLGYALEKLNELRPAVNEFRTATKLDPSDGSYRDHYVEAQGMLAAALPHKKSRW